MKSQDNDRVTGSSYFYVGKTPEITGRVHAMYSGILVLSKLCTTFAIFLLANFINTKLSHTVPWVANSRQLDTPPLNAFAAIIEIATFIQFGSGLVFIFLLSILKLNTLPKVGKELCRDFYGIRLILYSTCSTLVLFVRIGGIQLCGPFRTVFVGTYYDVTLTTLFSVCLLQSRLKWHLYGTALFALGILLEFFFDDSHLDHADEPWHLITNSIGLSMLLVSAILKFLFSGIGFTVNLAKASGGPIQLQSVSTLLSGIVLFILTILHLASGGDLIFFHALPVSFIVIFGFVVDLYIDEVVVKRMDATFAARLGTTASFFSAFIFVLVLSQIGTASSPGLFSLLSFGVIYVATFCLTTGANTDRSIFAYSSLGDGLPHTFRSSETLVRPSSQVNLCTQNATIGHAAVLIA